MYFYNTYSGKFQEFSIENQKEIFKKFNNAILTRDIPYKLKYFDDHCVMVRNKLFKMSDLQKSILFHDQWCKILPLLDKGICDSNEHNHFNRLGPIWPKCRYPMESYGSGDEEKRACGLNILVKEELDHDCIVLGFGSANMWEFEEAIYDRTNCKIITLDCFVDTPIIPPRISNRVSFFPVCVGGKDEILIIKNKPRSFITYSSLLKNLNIIYSPTFVKMDIEGSEYEVLDFMLKSNTLLPLQIAVEIHNYRNKNLSKLLDTIYSKGYDLIDRHDNPYCKKCSEVVFAKTICNESENRSIKKYCESSQIFTSSNYSDFFKANQNHELFSKCIKNMIEHNRNSHV